MSKRLGRLLARIDADPVRRARVNAYEAALLARQEGATMTDEQWIGMTIENCIELAADEGALEPHEAAALRREIAVLRPLRAAVLRYGRALQRIRVRDGSIIYVPVEAYNEWHEALETLDALALALAAEEGQG